MNRILFILCFSFCLTSYAQNVQVSTQTYTPQQLVEDILIDSNCIENINVTNVVGGDFGGTTQSYGYFEDGGSSFPFQSGIVLSTGRLTNVPGPNTSLSDDDAPNWNGDTDLENALNESNTTNATILEFDFTSVATQISFRYLFASEEYQENNPNTCQYSDLFGFLIRPSGTTQYTNIALVPDTQTPVKVTTVHPEIPGGCPAINQFYFDSWNDATAPINFNGQTKVLTATANVQPNQTYHVKLVIADEQNYRYDSAVFLEAGSFKLSTDLGSDLLVSTNSAICEGDTYTLSAFQQGNNTYKWFKDGVELTTETNATLTVSAPGTYSVEVTLDNNCLSFGEVVIEYTPKPIVANATLTECDQNQDGITYYNLFDAVPNLTLNDTSLVVSNFYYTQNDAINETNAIQNPSNFLNNTPYQTIFARVETPSRCYDIAQLQLDISNNLVFIPALETCDEGVVDGFTTFNLNDITASIQNQIPNDAIVSFYETEADAFTETNPLSTQFENTSINSQTIFVKITSNNQCFAITTAVLNVLYTPVLLDDETFIYCLNSYPDTIRLYGGVQNDSPSNYYYQWLFNGTSTPINTSFNDINETGTYTVIVTDPNGCSASRAITVTASNSATINNITIQDGTFNNTVSIQVSGEGTYEFALDDEDGTYQESNVFTNVLPGFHTVYVRDTNGCGITEQLISVLGFPKYFTPNGDNTHETWQVYGVNQQFYAGISIKIFDRYGKLLAIQNETDLGWDGTYNGHNLPEADYWYLVTLVDGKTFTGHFALIR